MLLPKPSAEQLQHQQQLLTHLNESCIKNGGKLHFEDFMQLVLYAPKLGYYSAGQHKIGAQGDFITAPEVSPLFSQCLAKQCSQILQTLSDNQSIILEVGAGSGKMACEIIHELSLLNQLPKEYWILEISADLIARQKKYLKENCPSYFKHCRWLTSLPESSFNGIVIANEVLDAMPVHLFQISENNSILEGQVCFQNDSWKIVFEPTQNERLKQAVTTLQTRLPHPLPSGYTSEINLMQEAWLHSIADSLNQGVIVLIDYGFPSHEYYHPSRQQGTLMCHYRHRAHPNPLEYIGLQDMTAHVDFTAVALSGKDCNLKLLGFTHQAAFLIANGLLDYAEKAVHSTHANLKISQQIQTLTAPHEMGELFKVLALGKNYSQPMQGFEMLDHRHRL